CTKKLEIERLVTCKTCHGTGARDGKEAFKSCPTCQGRGIITQQSGFFVQQSTCPTCHGTGEIISDPCPVCRGEGRVREDSHITIRIPAGVATGSQLRIAGEGDAGVHGGPTGDLHVFIDVKPHDIFQREGNDLSCTVPVPLSLAVSGGRLKVPTLEGAATIKLPEGTQNGMIFRLRGKGVKALRGSDVGDMLVEVEVEIPSRLTKEQVDKLNAFASALDENRNQPACVEFADKAARYLKGK
ncbi:MAG: DnaJ C-terminal domain-containing protein, partial [Akkermansia muciniphila]